MIANILNETAAKGEYPKELKEGILIPLQKPGKTKGPVEHLRPVILLSILRKVLAICIIRRVGKRIDNIPCLRQPIGVEGGPPSSALLSS